jgi:hypothetical protein
MTTSFDSMLLLMPEMNEEYRIAGVMLASVPMLRIYSLIGERYGMGESVLRYRYRLR